MKCNKCKKDLTNIKSASNNSKDYCLDCLKCVKCNSKQIVAIKDNEFYCKKCKELVEKGVVRNCDHCSKPFASGEQAITETDEVVRGPDKSSKKYYHKSCHAELERQRKEKKKPNLPDKKPDLPDKKPSFESNDHQRQKGKCVQCQKEDWIGSITKKCPNCWLIESNSAAVSYLEKEGTEVQSTFNDYYEKVNKPLLMESIRDVEDVGAKQRWEKAFNDLGDVIKNWKPTDKGKDDENPNKKDPNAPNEKKPKPDEICQKCGVSCIVHRTKTSYTIKRKRYIKHKTDFTRESSIWFGINCSCAREYREANQQTCPQCQKREFPHMKRGWMLDYEIKKAFCSPICHVTYRELKWEEAQRLSQVEMFPPELEVSNSGNQPNFNWEQQGLRNEVLLLREVVRELEQKLNNQSNLTLQERQQSNYLRNLQQNTLRNAENSYRNKWGNINENSPSKNGGGTNKGLIIGLTLGGVGLVATLVYFLWRKKNKSL